MTGLPDGIVVDGNDGTGKSTLVTHLRARGYNVHDRSFLTELTDATEMEALHTQALYASHVACSAIVLDARVATSQARLAEAGKDLAEKYHTEEDLTHYRRRFREVAEVVGVPLVDADGDFGATRVAAYAALGLPADGAGRVALPTGRLEALVAKTLGDSQMGGQRIAIDSAARAYHLTPGHHTPHYVRLKARSIPEAVGLGLVEAGFVTSDVLAESLYRDDLDVVANIAALPHDACIAVIAPHDVVREERAVFRPPTDRPLVIATEYPRLAHEWAYAQNIPHICVQTHGTTEAWVPMAADVGVDLVATGATLAANGLGVVRVLMSSVRLLFVMSKTRRTAFRAHAFVGAMRRLSREWP